MNKEEILKKAIEKAVKGGWKTNIGCNLFWEYKIYFSHSFAKAFWGEEEGFIEYLSDEVQFGKSWEIHLQQMVLEEEPLKYLEKFL